VKKMLSNRILVAILILLMLFAGSATSQSRRDIGNSRSGEGGRAVSSGTEAGRPSRSAPTVSTPVRQHPVSLSPDDPAYPPYPPPVQATVPGDNPVISVPDVYFIDQVPSGPEELVPLEVSLQDRFVQPFRAGYSFAKHQLLPWDFDKADLRYEVIGTKGFLMTSGDTRIANMGVFEDVHDIGGIPAVSASDRFAVALARHGYAVRLADDTLVRVWVLAATPDEVVFEWLPMETDQCIAPAPPYTQNGRY